MNSAEIIGNNAGFVSLPEEYTGNPPVILIPVPPPTPGGGGGGVSTTPVTAVAISGDAVVGQTLTATTTPSGATVTYQWMRSSSDDSTGAYDNITSATTNTYTLQSGDAGRYIKVKVTGNGSYSETVTSTASSKVLNTQSAPTGLTGVAPTTAGGNGKITGTTSAMEYKLKTAADNAYADCTATETTGLAAGTYVVRLKAVTDVSVASPTTEVTVLSKVAAPSGLNGVAPTTANDNDGKITGTTDLMEYKLKAANDSTYAICSATETTGLAAETYAVRVKAVPGVSVASDPTDVTVPAYAAKYEITIPNVSGSTTTVTTNPANDAEPNTIVSVLISNIEAGKQFKSIEVKDSDNQTVATTTVGSGTSYTFIMPAKSVTVTVTVEAVPAPGSSSADLIIGTDGTKIGAIPVTNASPSGTGNSITDTVNLSVPLNGADQNTLSFYPSKVDELATVYVCLNDGTQITDDTNNSNFLTFSPMSAPFTFNDSLDTLWVKVVSQSNTPKYYKISVTWLPVS